MKSSNAYFRFFSQLLIAAVEFDAFFGLISERKATLFFTEDSAATANARINSMGSLVGTGLRVLQHRLVFDWITVHTPATAFACGVKR